jgi:hypothetical protein
MPAAARRRSSGRTVPCLYGGTGHSWSDDGLDVLSDTPEAMGSPDNLVRTRHCLWCPRREYAVDDGGPPRWKADRR